MDVFSSYFLPHVYICVNTSMEIDGSSLPEQLSINNNDIHFSLYHMLAPLAYKIRTLNVSTTSMLMQGNWTCLSTAPTLRKFLPFDLTYSL